MIALLLLGLLACASAAPHYHHREPFSDDFFNERFLQDDMFDTRSFWSELKKDLLNLETIMDDFVKRFPSATSTAGIDGDVYKIVITLPGYESKDIVVKAKKGMAMIQAVHNYGGGSSKTYMDIRSLPDNVGESGKWTYEDDVLKVEFPMNGKDADASTDVTASPSLHSREEMEPDNTDTNHDADTGVDRGDVDVMTNTIPGASNGGIEATTYAVDLKDEVEFVPVRQV